MGTNRARDQAINGVNITSATDVRSVSLTANLEVSHSSSIPYLAKSPATTTEQYFSDQHKTNSIPPSLHWQSVLAMNEVRPAIQLPIFRLLADTTVSRDSSYWISQVGLQHLGGGTNDSNSFRLQ